MKNENYIMGNKNLRIVNDTDYLGLSIDPIILCLFANINDNKEVLEIGSGTGALSLILASKYSNQITAVEIQEELIKISKENFKLNNIDNKIKLINDDILNIYMDLPKYKYIISNPPYNKTSGIIPSNKVRSIATHEIKLDMDNLFMIITYLLDNTGLFYTIYPSYRLNEIYSCLAKNNLFISRIRLVYPNINKPSNLVLLEIRKENCLNVVVEKPLILNDLLGNYTEEIRGYINE